MRKLRFHNDAAGRLEIAHNALRAVTEKRLPVYIEDTTLYPDDVEVVFIDQQLLDSGNFVDDDFKTVMISLKKLKNFIVLEGMDVETYDRADNDGKHVQEARLIPMHIYLDENLNTAVKAYIEAGKEFSHA